MDKNFRKLLRQREEISVRYDPDTATIWCYFNPKIRPCYTMKMLQEAHELQLSIIDYFKMHDMKPKVPIRYYVMASLTPEVYNYGGDLNLFSKLIINQDRETLHAYAKICIDIVYLNAVNFNLPITTISLVKGTALGGGFEGALSCNILIAEENTKMGLPEIRFNLFPGMGAYSFLARSIGIKNAEEMIKNGKVYDAQTLYEKGVITILAKPNEGEKELEKFIKKHSKVFNGMQAITSVRHRYNPIEHSELMDITEIWVDAALRLEPKDLKVMQKLVEVQDFKSNGTIIKTRTKQDRRISQKPTIYPLFDNGGNQIFEDRRSGADRRLCI